MSREDALRLPSGNGALNAGFCAQGTLQVIAGVSVGSCAIVGSDGKQCIYNFICIKFGGVEASVGTEAVAGISGGTGNLGGVSVGISGSLGVGVLASGGISGSAGGVVGNLGLPAGIGVAVNPSIDFCIWKPVNASCTGGSCGK